MKKVSFGQLLPVFFMPGFIAGVLYVNFVAVKYVAEPEIFGEYYLRQLVDVPVAAESYIWYLVRLRFLPLLALAVFAFTKAGKAVCALFTAWFGLCAGVLLAEAVSCMGIYGSIFCVAGVIPQIFFYVPAYLIILRFAGFAPHVRWNRQKTVFVLLMSGIGLATELYVNPVVVKAFLSVIYLK